MSDALRVLKLFSEHAEILRNSRFRSPNAGKGGFCRDKKLMKAVIYLPIIFLMRMPLEDSFYL
jgi:hypothetical protein